MRLKYNDVGKNPGFGARFQVPLSLSTMTLMENQFAEQRN